MDVIISIQKTCSLEGSNDTGKDLWIEFSEGDYLKDGTYYYTDGYNTPEPEKYTNSDDDIFTYIYGRKIVDGERIKGERLCDSRFSDTFVINHNYYNMYYCGVHVLVGAKDISINLYPFVSNKKISYEPARVRDSGAYRRYYSNIPSEKEIKNKDIKLFERFVKFQLRNNCDSFHIYNSKENKEIIGEVK